MQTANVILHQFLGTRITYDCVIPFETVLQRIYCEVGGVPVDIPGISGEWHSVEQFVKQMEILAQKSDFMLFDSFNHGEWIKKFGVRHRVVRLIVGNPLIAITLMEHDISSGLFVPVELLLDAEDGRIGCTLTYVLPSSLIVVKENKHLAVAANGLDEKLKALIEKVVSL